MVCNQGDGRLFMGWDEILENVCLVKMRVIGTAIGNASGILPITNERCEEALSRPVTW